MRATLRHSVPGEVDHERIWGWIIAGLFAAGLLLREVQWLRPFSCLVREATGIPCLTCGTTRAIDALLQGRIGDALRFHTLAAIGFTAGFAYLVYALSATHLRLRRIRIELTHKEATWVRWSIPIVLTLQWVFLIIDGR